MSNLRSAKIKPLLWVPYPGFGNKNCVRYFSVRREKLLVEKEQSLEEKMSNIRSKEATIVELERTIESRQDFGISNALEMRPVEWVLSFSKEITLSSKLESMGRCARRSN